MIGVRNFGPQQSEALVSEAEDAVGHGVKEKVSLRANRCLMAQARAWTKGPSGRSKCLVAELFSPPCFSKVAKQYGKKSLAFDILQGWDLNDRKTQCQVDKLLDQQYPELLVACTPCVHLGRWYHLNQQHLTLLQRCQNRRIAQKQADFVLQQIKIEAAWSWTVLAEHPWSLVY